MLRSLSLVSDQGSRGKQLRFPLFQDSITTSKALATPLKEVDSKRLSEKPDYAPAKELATPFVEIAMKRLPEKPRSALQRLCPLPLRRSP